MNPAKGQQGRNAITQLMGEDLDKLDILAQKTVHNGKHYGSKSKP